MGRFLHEDAEAYLQTDRAGRGQRLTANQRETILRMYQRYMQELKNRRQVDPAEFVRISYRYLREGRAPQAEYEFVIVDEVQDLSELSLKLLHGLAGDRRDGLLLVGDAAQRIYTRGYSMAGLGIDISGRSIVLRKNYRNTRQILEAAFPLVLGDWEAETLSAGLSPSDCRPEFSARDGSRPIIVRCATLEEELVFVAREIAFLMVYDRYVARDICVLARTKDYRQRVLDGLRECGIPAREFRADQDEEGFDGVGVSTLHNAKGHEYKAVFIVGMSEGIFPQPSIEELATERALLYVGMTRARDLLYLSHAESLDGKPAQRSSFLAAIREACDPYVFRRSQDSVARIKVMVQQAIPRTSVT